MSNPTIQPLPYIQRATLCANPVARELLLIMEEKQSNLAVALDVTTKEELLGLIEAVASHVCLVKIHIDIIENFDIHLLLELQELAKKRRFLILEDRKFSDTGKTVQQQYEDGIYKIANWAHLVSAHPSPGSEVVEGLRRVGLPKGRGLLLIDERGSGAHNEAIAHLAHNYSDFIVGFIGNRSLAVAPYFIHMAPNIDFNKNGSRYPTTPEEAIGKNGSDVIIVGSSITEASSPTKEAQSYQLAGWEAYQGRLGIGSS